MVASVRAILPGLLFLVAWAGLPGSVLANTGAGTGTPSFCLPTGGALSGGDTFSHVRLDEGRTAAFPQTHCEPTERPLGSVPSGMLTGVQSRMRIAGKFGQAMPDRHAGEERIPFTYRGIAGKGSQKLRIVDTAFGKLSGPLTGA